MIHRTLLPYIGTFLLVSVLISAAFALIAPFIPNKDKFYPYKFINDMYIKFMNESKDDNYGIGFLINLFVVMTWIIIPVLICILIYGIISFMTGKGWAC